MSSFPKRKAPASARILDEWIRARAKETDDREDRLRRGVAYMVLSAALDKLRDTDGSPLFVLKGGVSMHLRARRRARLSLDYDTIFRRPMTQLERVLAGIVNHPIGKFQVRPIGKPEKIEHTPAYRQRIQITYNNTPWANIPLEVSPPEGHSTELKSLEALRPDPELELFGIEAIGNVPTMSVAYQIAQKLHACTDTPLEGENERATDLMDLQLLEEDIPADGLPTIHAACIETFALRGKHAWPPQVTVWSSWASEYRRITREFGFPVTDVEVAANNVRALIQRIDDAILHSPTARTWIAIRLTTSPAAKTHLVTPESGAQTLCGRPAPRKLVGRASTEDPERILGVSLCSVCRLVWD
jgi:hypothetical protein